MRWLSLSFLNCGPTDSLTWSLQTPASPAPCGVFLTLVLITLLLADAVFQRPSAKEKP